MIDCPTLLVCEDDTPIRRGIVEALSCSGYQVIEAADGEEALGKALEENYDLMLLDLVMPRRDGFEVLEAVSKARPGTPVIILSARGEEDDRVRGLALGADDYVVKPFSVRELVARVEAVLRRSPERTVPDEVLSIPGGRADLGKGALHFDDGESVSLSDREVEILRYLGSHAGRTVSREEILRRVWGLDPRNLETRTIDVHVGHLRVKLRDPKLIRTVRGKGYQLAI